MIVGTHPVPASVPGMKFFQGYMITEALMQQLAALMPPQYRGHYADAEHAQASAGVLVGQGQI